jgi:predicted metal-binding protein
LYLAHRDELLTHYKNSPTYVVGGLNPREAAKALVERLMLANDPQLASFAEHMKSTDPEHLAHLLLAPCHFDLDAMRSAASGDADLPA